MIWHYNVKTNQFSKQKLHEFCKRLSKHVNGLLPHYHIDHCNWKSPIQSFPNVSKSTYSPEYSVFSKSPKSPIIKNSTQSIYFVIFSDINERKIPKNNYLKLNVKHLVILLYKSNAFFGKYIYVYIYIWIFTQPFESIRSIWCHYFHLSQQKVICLK